MQVKPFLLLPLGILSFVIAGCGADAQQTPNEPPPTEVTFITVTPQTVPITMELPATLEGSRSVEIRARVSGILEKRNFEEGTQVTAGQSLYTIDPAQFTAALSSANADLASAQARLNQAERNLVRLIPLRDQHVVAQKEYDDALSAKEVAQAELLAAKARRDQAQLNLDYASVQSPISGIASRSLVDEGTLVTGPDMLLTRITQLDPIHIRFGLSEQEQLQLRNDASIGNLELPENGRWTAEIRLPNGSLYGSTGEVDFSDVRVNEETGTSEMRAVIPNPDQALRPGQFIRVKLSGANRLNAMVVPQRAVLDGTTGKYVYQVGQDENGGSIAIQVPVDVGDWVTLANGENGWVIRSGLQEGDRVIVDGVARIFFPGAPIQPIPDNLFSAE